MLTRGTTAEVRSGQQNRSTLVLRLIQLKLRIEGTVLVESPIVEQELSKSRSLNPLQELFGNNLIGVYVDSIQGGQQTFEPLESFHQLHPRTSTKWPSMAAAAAMAGLTKWVRPPRP